MMIHDPDITKTGLVVERLTEFVDLFPTLVELAGFPPLNVCPENSSKIELCTEGMSMVPLMKDPLTTDWKSRAFSQYPRNKNHVIESFSGYVNKSYELGKKYPGYDYYMGYTMRTDRYRYTEWVRFSGKPKYKIYWDKLKGAELYDHVTDPQENKNLIHKQSHKALVKGLSEMLHAGWRHALPGSPPDSK